MDYQALLKLMEQQRLEALTISEKQRISRDIQALKKWLESGQAGSCPVDLRAYGVEGEPPFSPESESVAPGEEQPSLLSPAEDENEIVELDEEALAREATEHNQRLLRADLEQARRYLDEGDFRAAIALAAQVESRAEGDLQGIAADLLAQARMRLNQTLTEALKSGDAARDAGDLTTAREAYRRALSLEPENEHARQALLDLERKSKESLSQEQLTRLRIGLKERRDIVRLGEAVYDAETLAAEERLPADLMALLQEARQEYDRIRREHGEETTKMRYGDVQARAEAVKQIEKWLTEGKKFIWDSTLDKERPASEVLQEARQRLQEVSQETAQYELSLAEKFKGTRPHYTRERLKKALDLPFQDNDRKKLEEKLAEVEELVKAQEKAGELQSRAEQEVDPLQRLSLLLEAKSIFPSLSGLEEQIAQSILAAEAILKTHVEENLRRAQVALDAQEFKKVYEVLGEAKREIARWPRAELPPALERLRDELKALEENATATEMDYVEYQRLASEIRQKVQSEKERAVALGLFNQVVNDLRFKKFSDLRVLAAECDQYKGADELLRDAKRARQENDWGRLYQITREALESGKAGQLQTEFQSLYDEAVIEINIARAQELLASDEIPEANSIISSMLKREKERNPQREEWLRERLKVEWERIQQAIENTPPLRALYELACNQLGLLDEIAFRAYVNPSFALRQARVTEGQPANPQMRAFINLLKGSAEEPDPSPEELVEKAKQHLLAFLKGKDVDRRLQSLRIFRYVGGISEDKEADWPPYAVSLRTSEARRAANLLADSVRQDVLQPLMEEYQRSFGRELEMDDETLRQWALRVEQLRSGALLEAEEERKAARWIEITWGKRRAANAESSANWEMALRVWQHLDSHYPGHPEVTRGLRRARVQHTIQRARYLLYNDHKGGEAVEMLKGLQREPEMDSVVEIYLALAEIYADLDEFDAAFGNLEQVERIIQSISEIEREKIQKEIEAKRREVQQKQLIFTYTSEAREKEREGQPLEAIRLLQQALADQRLKDKEPLRMLMDEIYRRSSESLRQQADEGQDKGTDEGKIEAVIALVELQALEELMGIPPEHRRSTEGLNRLRSELAEVAKAVVRMAMDFEPTTMPLEQAIQKAEALSARLQLFDNVVPIFNAELEPVRESLTKRRRDISAYLDHLRQAREILAQASEPRMWEEAIRSGDFSTLRRLLERIVGLELNALDEAQKLERRIDEMEEIHEALMDKVRETRQKFEKEGDFSAVQVLVTEASTLPQFRRNGQIWQSVSVREYEALYRSFGDRLRIPDIYGSGDLVGWEQVKEEAQARRRELDGWEEWERRCARKMDMAEQAFRAAENYGAQEPIRQRKAAWERAREAAQAALQALKYETLTSGQGEVESAQRASGIGPLDDQGVPIPARSRKAREYLDEGKRRAQVAEEWLHRAEMEIAELEGQLQQRGFPTEAEFAKVVELRDAQALAKLLERARQAGITDEIEKRRVETYARVLEEWQQKPKKRFLDLFR